MRCFSYIAVTPEGKTVNGAVEATDEAAVQGMLEHRGLYPVSISPGSALWVECKRLLLGRRVKRIEVIEFAQNLAVMLRAGVPIMAALDDIIATTEHPAFSAILIDIRQQVGQGATFTAAIEAHEAVFPDIFIRLVRIGEETGQFDTSLTEIADHLRKVEEMNATIRQSMIYPLFAVSTTLGALLFWMVYVLPKIIQTLKGLGGGTLPLMTRLLITASDLSRRFWWLYLIVPIAAVATVKLLKRNGAARYYLDRIMLSIPVMKDLVHYWVLGLFAEQLRILIRAGLTIDRSLAMVADVIGNELFRRALLRVREAVMCGSFISDALKLEKIFPVLVIRMVNVGENSGTLDSQFAFLADHYSTRLNKLAGNLGKVLEPVVIIGVGVVFAIIILGLMLPIYDLVSQVGGGGRR